MGLVLCVTNAEKEEDESRNIAAGMEENLLDESVGR